jgi:hypothetical protein
MDQIHNIFVECEEKISSEKIISKIKKGEINDIFNGLCKIKDGIIIIDYTYFKHFASLETYPVIISLITNNIDEVLKYKSFITVYLNMKTLTVTDIDKHKTFIYHILDLLNKKYPKKLDKCYVYNAPYIFSQIYNIVSLIIDKDTLMKIELMCK